MAEADKTRRPSEILDYTTEQFERYKWEQEQAAHERELLLKEREDRRSFFKSPLILSIVGAMVAFLANIANDAYTKGRNLAEATRASELALIQKTMDQDDPMRVISKLRLLDAAGMIPGHRDQLRRLWTDEAAAQLFVGAAPPPAASTTPAVPPQPCQTAQANPAGEIGWLYLGWANPTKTAWMQTDKGTGSVHFEQPTPQGAGFLGKLRGLCLHVTKSKFLRDDGPPGEKVKAPVKELVTPAKRMRILAIDEGAPDDKGTHHVIWAQVEVLAN